MFLDKRIEFVCSQLQDIAFRNMCRIAEMTKGHSMARDNMVRYKT